MTLRDLSHEMELLLNAIAENDGELTDEIAAQYTATREQIDKKVEDYATYMSTLKSEADMLDEEIKRLTAKRNSNRNLIERLKSNLLFNMSVIEMDSVKTDHYKVSVRKNKSIEVSEDYLSSMANNLNIVQFKTDCPFIRVKLEVDKTAINTHVKEGGEMPEFATIIEKESLTIK